MLFAFSRERMDTRFPTKIDLNLINMKEDCTVQQGKRIVFSSVKSRPVFRNANHTFSNNGNSKNIIELRMWLWTKRREKHGRNMRKYTYICFMYIMWYIICRNYGRYQFCIKFYWKEWISTRPNNASTKETKLFEWTGNQIRFKLRMEKSNDKW